MEAADKAHKEEMSSSKAKIDPLQVFFFPDVDLCMPISNIYVTEAHYTVNYNISVLIPDLSSKTND